MCIKSPADLEKLKIIGSIVRKALDTTAAAVRPGITTAELDRIADAVLVENGAEASPPKVYNFPGSFCISVNDEAIHGIPGDRVIHEGDLVKLDATADKDGYFADAAITVCVGKVSKATSELARCAESAFRKAAQVARAGNRINEIGRAVEKETRRCGFQVMKAYCGHGVGSTIHEAPQVLNYYDPGFQAKLTEGLVLTIEPIISAGKGKGVVQRNRWTVCTADGSMAAHYEHTLVITKGEPVLITAA
jgi:methionyl aminopeptidase